MMRLGSRADPDLGLMAGRAGQAREYGRQLHHVLRLMKEPALIETTAAPAVTGFHHFSPTVSDVEASAQWYERVFGMNRVPVTFPHHGGEKGGFAVVLMEPRS